MPSPLPPFSALSARQEAFAGSYIRAVISLAGCSIAIPETDNDKVDIVAMSRVKGSKFTKPKIDIQSKCKLGPVPTGDPISYTLNMETYDNLRDPLVTNPRILVVVFVPELHPDWVVQDEAQLALRHCGYWTCLQGEPEVTGQDSKTVHLPKANVFSAAALQAMMVSASNGVSLTSPLTLGALE
ncbi:DUF4365 domain-containing protein [Prosthecomicrobium pneumaticum]|uniref:DUF4365 domain-containing protein n=1 Tax=Prosthecomicrobium pneumaticum TaxID=81895 RepID=A0A7W9CSI6_9HYPH|nr:DUF4365 domain-containing protein [Prosthecomicrobium pneumaticum]MBB5750997.1 hypothetical protein [Prosthecomicrobium pneumaticum]